MSKYLGSEQFHHRLEMCKRCMMNEGTELQDVVGTLCEAARMLHGFEDFKCQIVLVIAEEICEAYVKEEIWSRECEWEEYNRFDSQVYAHFTGGAQKLSKEEFERNSR